MGKIQERVAAYDNISKVLELMRKKKAPVKSQRKLDKKPKKLDVEKFLPKDRPKTVLDEKINSRRIKQALEEEYQRVQGKTNTKAAEALKKLVTKSTETNIQEQLASEIAKEKEKKTDISNLLEYFESKETPEQLLNRVAEYVDADPATKKEVRELVKLGGYRDLAVQKSIVKKFMGGTPAQRALMITDIEATPKALSIKTAMKAEQAFAKLEKERLEVEEKDKKIKLKQEEKAIELKMQEDAILEKQTKGIKLKKGERFINDSRIAREAEEARLAELARIAAEAARRKDISTSAKEKILASGKVIALEKKQAKEVQRLANKKAYELTKAEADRLAKVEADR